MRRREGVREVREGDAGAAGDAVQAAGRLHGAQPQEDSLEDPLEVRRMSYYTEILYRDRLKSFS